MTPSPSGVFLLGVDPRTLSRITDANLDYVYVKQVKPGFTNYQPQPKYSLALSKIEGKGKLGKTEDP